MPPRTLIIDTATPACSVALIEAGRVTLGYEHEVVGRGHAERLIPMIASLPDGGRAEHILVDVGPGSFTGIRVGIAAARGLALGWGASVSGYSSLSLIAMDYFLFGQCGDTAFAVVIEGGHGEVFMQRFAGRPDFGALDEPASLKPADAIARLDGMEAVGTGVERLVDLPPAQRGPALLPWALLARELPESYRMLPPHPFYGRAPDAKLPGGVVPA
ncbi:MULTISPECIES: tRNA (adenosine(37)-N6)-threonylcarbamoyltransferase complex dimerization subunit type 1 TsaB [Sphingomonas]|jgi:tRNA threonylcarbamoyladenosine biosynthesis protein TsaB|uniref:tRNA (adenosine(37)-N6)-threonylcarbamoyltransferase complex dimerization subunit type 1 TsaB n=1 Tax=Sphingomonas TaxID=13687 RepID=UPI000830EE6A|nr:MULTISPECIES: tRNA (adenosine(37)-N6)-threonylcarbamoyltransferase complex dimerization subunit type 1 TsaB [Sphingomonas]MBY0302885.1 tRNA (adenosine(37)-N6)-threonylcarbamoyltransferase complex dimerization subunit type 1 TsaB [Sphingomonas ginsenosidimutans]